MNSARLKGTFIEFSYRLVGHKVGKPHFCQTKKINQPQTLCSSTDCASSAHVQSWMSWIFEQNLWDETGLKWWDKATCRKLDEMSFSLGWNDIWKKMDSQRCWKSEQTSLWDLVWIFPPSGSTAKSKWLIVCRARKRTYQKIQEKTIHWSIQSKTNMEEKIKQAILKIGQPLTV